MKQIRLIAVGKMKKGHYLKACEDYAKRIRRYFPLEEIMVKDATGGKEPRDKSSQEGRSILERISQKDLVVCLDERGATMDTPSFAGRLGQWIEDPAQAPCFILGGAFGLSPEVRSVSRLTLSLGPMTMPHELARVVLLEQLYRASTILHGHPYHHS